MTEKNHHTPDHDKSNHENNDQAHRKHEHFEVIIPEGNEILIIDIEVYAKENKPVPKGHHYIISIDRQKHTVKQECMSGREILQLAEKTPIERFQLNQRLKGGKVEKISYDEIVCFTKPGIEKFMTIPLDQTEGEK